MLPLFLVAAVFLLPCATAFADATTITVRPNVVNIGAGYDGTKVVVSGTIPEGTKAVVRVLGERKDQLFKQKGRALGVLWMNLKTIKIKQVPDLFLMGTDGKGNTNWEHSTLGFLSIKGDTKDLVFDEFIKLMEKDDFYEVEKGTVTYSETKEGKRPFKASLAIPSAIHEGIYDVEVLAVQKGQIVDKASCELHTSLVGLPAMLSAFAFDHSLLYGIAAVVIAILAGLIMSMIFKERGSAH